MKYEKIDDFKVCPSDRMFIIIHKGKYISLGDDRKGLFALV